jgi:hypothetical protein
MPQSEPRRLPNRDARQGRGYPLRKPHFFYAHGKWCVLYPLYVLRDQVSCMKWIVAMDATDATDH